MSGEAGGRRREREGRGSESIPRWLAPVVYGVLTLFLFRAFVFSDQMLVGQDTFALGYMARDFFAHALRDLGIFPLWNPLVLGGTPFLDSLAGGDSLYPPSLLLLLITETHRAIGWKLVVHVFAAGLFMHGWLRTLGTGRGAALVGGTAYLLAPFMVTLVYPGHDGKLFVTALTPLLFTLTERGLRRGGLLAYAGLAVAIGLVILTTHFQAAYFLFGALGVYAIVRTIQIWRAGSEGRVRVATTRFGLFLGAALVGGGIASVQLLPAVDYVTEFSRRTATTTRADATRGLEYSSQFSLHPEEIVSLAVPEFIGNGIGGGTDWTSDTYWGRNPLKLNHEYLGIVVLLLAGLAFLPGRRTGLRWLLGGIALVALLFTLGLHTPVWRIFYEVVPGISLFRAPSIAIFVAGFAVATLAGLGLDDLISGSASPSSRYLYAVPGALLILTALAATGLLFDVWTSVLYPEIGPGQLERLERLKPMAARGFFLATLLAGGASGLVAAAQRRLIPVPALVAGLVVLVSIDLIRVDAPFIQTVELAAVKQRDPIIETLLTRQAQEDPFRVLSVSPIYGMQDNTPGTWGLEQASGHHPNDLARYRELIGMEGGGAPMHLLQYPRITSLLNVRYLVWAPRLGEYPGVAALEPIVATEFQGQPWQSLYAFPGLPRARLVGSARMVPEDETVAYMTSEAFDPTREVLLTEAPPIELPDTTAAGEVAWIEHGINRMRLRVNAPHPALLVIADNWYPAWKAEVDGAEAPVLRAYHTLRAIPVSTGEHEVELHYDAGPIRRGLIVSLLSFGLTLGVGLVGWLRSRGREGRGIATPDPDAT